MEVIIDDAQWREIGRALDGVKKGVPKVLTRATNKTLITVKSESAKAVYAELNLTQKRIKKNIKIHKMRWDHLQGDFSTTGKPVNLIDFTGTRPVKKGVSVKVKRGSKKSTIPHAFITYGRGGVKRIVGRRKYRGDRTQASSKLAWPEISENKLRYPVEWLTGPRIEDIYAEIFERDETLDRYSKTYLKNINHELDRELSKL